MKGSNTTMTITKKDIDNMISKMDNTLELIDLERNIETVRNEMVSIGMSKGLSHPETIELSQQLDTLLNRLNQLKRNQG
jgi:stage 0 sporulation regulatory protein